PAGSTTNAVSADYTREDAVFEKLSVDITLREDGGYRQESFARIRIQSEAAGQQFGVVSFAYERAHERVGSLPVQVRKRDGSVVVTPESNIQDLASEAARTAPSYTDAREKQAPVKGLSVGDVLEYRVVMTRVRPEAEGHF